MHTYKYKEYNNNNNVTVKKVFQMNNNKIDNINV